MLDVGTGTGFPAAVIARLARRVFTIEREEELFHAARMRFEACGLSNVTAIYGDGLKGWPPQAPFDRIFVWGAIGREPANLLKNSLAPEGAMVFPLGRAEGPQRLTLWRGGEEIDLGAVRFSPLATGVAKRWRARSGGGS